MIPKMTRDIVFFHLKLRKVHSVCCVVQVRSARQQVQKPGVMEGELEPDSTLWCYFCQLEVARHVTDRLTTVVWGGLLEHMARCVGTVTVMLKQIWGNKYLHLKK